MEARILIVDDDKQFSSLVGEQLSEKYEVLFARDGLEAIHAVQEQRPDLVLLDVMMPRMDGWEALRLIREFSQVPIVMVSCRTSEADKVRGLELGADDYVTKPFGPREFLARIRAALRRGDSPITTPQIVKVGDRLVIDRARQEAYVHGEPVNLSATEYELLSCLLDNAGFVCTHRTLLVQVWGWEYTDQADYLKVYIHHLRKKIEEDPQHPRHIHTERGKGYRFDACPSN
ncbi:MAG: response regulator transcription factor [Anaerolineae bacterium]|jgi:two-component system KDP operon response regulator KdpE